MWVINENSKFYSLLIIAKSQGKIGLKPDFVYERGRYWRGEGTHHLWCTFFTVNFHYWSHRPHFTCTALLKVKPVEDDLHGVQSLTWILIAPVLTLNKINLDKSCFSTCFRCFIKSTQLYVQHNCQKYTDYQGPIVQI